MPVCDFGSPAGVPVVALVASAGGLQALTDVLERLPSELPASVVVLLHQDPDRPADVLRKLLANRSALPVSLAEDRQPLIASRVLVIPPGRHLLVTATRRVSVFKSGVFPPNRPSADLLFATMASALGPRAIAVVLSGTGHDGATGATAIHACGGTVIATDKTTSAEYGMPRATIERDHAIDHIVALKDIANLIDQTVRGPQTR